MAKAKRGLSETERAERRRRDRERLQHAERELLTSDGWRRWVRARALFHNYSLRNCLLLAAQCHERGIEGRRIAGFRTWLKLGRCVRKGEKGLVVLAPMPIKRREDSKERDEARVVFRSAFVFDTLSRESPGRAERRRRASIGHDLVEGAGVGSPERPGGSRRWPNTRLRVPLQGGAAPS